MGNTLPSKLGIAQPRSCAILADGPLVTTDRAHHAEPLISESVGGRRPPGCATFPSSDSLVVFRFARPSLLFFSSNAVLASLYSDTLLRTTMRFSLAVIFTVLFAVQTIAQPFEEIRSDGHGNDLALRAAKKKVAAKKPVVKAAPKKVAKKPAPKKAAPKKAAAPKKTTAKKTAAKPAAKKAPAKAAATKKTAAKATKTTKAKAAKKTTAKAAKATKASKTTAKKTAKATATAKTLSAAQLAKIVDKHGCPADALYDLDHRGGRFAYVPSSPLLPQQFADTLSSLNLPAACSHLGLPSTLPPLNTTSPMYASRHGVEAPRIRPSPLPGTHQAYGIEAPPALPIDLRRRLTYDQLTAIPNNVIPANELVLVRTTSNPYGVLMQIPAGPTGASAHRIVNDLVVRVRAPLDLALFQSLPQSRQAAVWNHFIQREAAAGSIWMAFLQGQQPQNGPTGVDLLEGNIFLWGLGQEAATGRWVITVDIPRWMGQ
ncbi:hypothetical protein HMN09_00851100 [Mycena chlorophos]|uniref:Uncharacterized protein n=1 Tax=Mycena chlorophos TaxID=658473 RepID=A0A8H6W7G4_MYCCL|nr:hypothetical protein HMN09_00851100 [Mycena chlorophos]